MIHTFEFYGGYQEYNDETDELLYQRIYGSGSNMMCLLLFLIQLKTKNIYPKKIITKLLHYHNINFYDHIFDINLEKFDEWVNYSVSEAESFLNSNSLNLWGMGTSRSSINFNLLSSAMNTYFNFKPEIILESYNIFKKYDINTDKDTFIWWRKSDKPTEIKWYRHNAEYPTVDNFLSLLEYNNKEAENKNLSNLRAVDPSVDRFLPLLNNNNNIFLQTDDENIKNEVLAKTAHINFKVLDHLPTCSNSEGFHYIINNTDPTIFSSKYNSTISEHLCSLFSLILTASRCKSFIGYPGTISYIVLLLRKSFDNFIFFKDDLDFY
jgi:hypothetical protein